mmetsp:Transcript_47195/g.47632  ORF Transcript_47195/g.47632 Transcript_47195/m.47632 type:complete len:133 (-) Transcript_47195:360-758(-)
MYSVGEICEIMEENKGNSKKIIKYCIGKRLIPVKVSQMYEIFHAYTRADATGKLSMSWKASRHPQILSDTSLESALNVHKRDTGRGISSQDTKDMLKAGLIRCAEQKGLSTLLINSPSKRTVRNYMDYAKNK